MADWAGAYGAGGGADSLRQLLTDKLLAAKVVEENRRAAAQEAMQQAQMQQRAEEVRAAQAQRMTEFVDARDTNYQDRLAQRDEFAAGQARESVKDAQRLRERGEDAARDDARFKAEQEGRAGEMRSRQAFERELMGMRQGGGVSEKDKIETERARLQLDAERRVAGQAANAPAPADTFKSDLDRFSADVFNHPGLSRAGTGFNIGRSYNTDFGNLKGAQKQLVNMYLNDPEVQAKIKAMKPATEGDVQRALAAAVNIDVETMDAPAIKREIDRLRTKAGLKPLGGGQAGGDAAGGTVTMRTPDGRTIYVPESMVAEAEKRGAKR